jgi:hypothetical protein
MVASLHPPTPSKDPFSERPFLVFWEVTRACALACKHCRAEAQPKRHAHELNEAEALNLVDQLAELKPPMLILTGGDPLMHWVMTRLHPTVLRWLPWIYRIDTTGPAQVRATLTPRGPTYSYVSEGQSGVTVDATKFMNLPPTSRPTRWPT